MNLKGRLTISIALAALASVATAQVDERNPGSLWPAQYVNPFLDRTAKSEGDIVTILISEVSTGTFTAATSNAKTVNNSISKALGPIIGGLIPNMSTLGSTKTDAKGATSQVGKLTARMTAVIKKVLPNGTMVIE